MACNRGYVEYYGTIDERECVWLVIGATLNIMEQYMRECVCAWLVMHISRGMGQA